MLAKMGGSAKAYAAVVLTRLMYSGMHVVSKVALDQGMNPLVFVFYRHTTAALVLIPITFVLERSDCYLCCLGVYSVWLFHV